MGNRKNQILWAIMIFPLTAIMSLDRTAMAVSAPLVQKEFHLSLGQMSIILTSLFFTYAIFNFLLGPLVDRIGTRRSLSFAAIWWSAFTALTAIGRSFASLTFMRAFVGMGQAPDWPAAERSIVEQFDEKERGLGNSILLGGLYLGPIIGTPLTVQIMSNWGWRASFYIYAAVGLLIGLIWYLVYRDKTRPTEKKLEPSIPWRLLVRSGRVWVLGAQAFCYVAVLSFFVTWLPTYLVKSRGFSLHNMAYAATLPAIALFIMVFIVGPWQDRVYRKTNSLFLARVPFAIGGFILSTGFLVAASIVKNPTLLVAFLTLSQGSIGFLAVTIWAVTGDLGKSSAGALTGWVMMWANLANALGPIFTALITGLTGSWMDGILILGIMGIVGAGLWVFVHPERPLLFENADNSTIVTTD